LSNNSHMKFTIKNRIYLSFSLLVSLFIINAIITFISIDYNKKLSKHIAEVIDPSLQSMEKLHDMMVQSKMYTTNWIFLRANQDDKNALVKIHSTDYPLLKLELEKCVADWVNKNWVDSLQNVMSGFEELEILEKNIAGSLNKFEDYDDPVIKFGAEEMLENIVLPRTTELMTSLERIIAFGGNLKLNENKSLNTTSADLRMMIILLVITIIIIGIFLSVYMSRKIIRPINMIREIINDLGKGIIHKVNHKASEDEIGEMIQSVNNLSGNLQMSASFAHEIGNRNFNIPFKPLSEQDALGKALITMRDNLKTSDEKLNEAQAIAHTGNWEVDLKGNVHAWSDELYKIYGVIKTEVKPSVEFFLSFMHPEDAELAQNEIKNAFEKLSNSSLNFRFIRKDGVIRHGYAEWRFELDKEGNPVRLYGIVMDITERKESEIALRESEAFNKGVLTSLTSHIAVIDEYGILIAANKAWDDFAIANGETNLKRTSLGSNYFEVCRAAGNDDPLAKEALEGILKVLKKEQSVFELDYPCHSPTEQRWFTLRAMNFESDTPKVVLTHEDISESRKAKEKVKASEIRYRSLIENSADMIGMMDETGKFIYVSPGVIKKFGYSYEEIYSMTITEVIHPDDMEKAKAFLGEVFKTPMVPINDLVIRERCKDGNYIWAEGTITNLLALDGVNAIVANFRDITERKEQQDTLENSNKELKKSNMELDRFVYSVSHDLRAPLLSMLGIVEISEEETTDPFMIQHLGFLKASITKLDGFVIDILEYSRNARTEVKNQEINFKEMLTDITSDLKYIGGNKTRHVDIKFEIKNQKLFHSDKSRISILLNNLISNAIRYQNPLTDNPFVDIQIDMSDTETGIIVKDNGIGISKENQKKIFDMFYRVSEKSVGSGLGLYLVKEIVEKLDGHIELESEIGKGTSFNIVLPN
jgi:PAS domain S-box-containing protein